MPCTAEKSTSEKVPQQKATANSKAVNKNLWIEFLLRDVFF
jgi:hypothetical protein